MTNSPKNLTVPALDMSESLSARFPAVQVKCIEHSHAPAPRRHNGGTYSTRKENRQRMCDNFRIMHSGALNRANAFVYWHGDRGRESAFMALENAAEIRRQYAAFLKGLSK